MESTDKPEMTAAELRQALEMEKTRQLRDITLRNRARDVNNTTSLNDLSLARKLKKLRRNDGNNGRSPAMESSSPAQLEPTSLTLPPETKPVNTPTTDNGPVDLNSSDQNWDFPLDPAITAEPVPQVQPRSASGQDVNPIKWEAKRESSESGLEISSDASEASNDSNQALRYGRLFQRQKPVIHGGALAGFDGKMQPPPIDWNDRPRFNNNNPEFRNAFARWTADVSNTCGIDDHSFRPIPYHLLRDLDLHPDGLDLVPRTYLVDGKTASRYGFTDIADATKYALPTQPEDFEDWGKLDMSRADNKHIRDETTEILVQNWIANTEEQRMNQQVRFENKQRKKAAKDEAAHAAQIYKSELSAPNRSMLNIYVRPALKTDVPQLTTIYNYYVENSCRPTELNPITEDDMRQRLSTSKGDKLPFIVAVARNRKSMKKSTNLQVINSSHPIQNIDPSASVMEGVEHVVGWASAQDFTASDYLERISSELEIYVDPESRLMGVGCCLMDQILESLDRGYVKKGGYEFRCAPEFRHMFSPGGGRDVHKILIVLRKYKCPTHVESGVRSARQTAMLTNDKIGISRNTNSGKIHDSDSDYDQWLRAWLETWGFKLEACLSGIGAKHGRFIDTVYLSRETAWQPVEGKIPDPLPSLY